MLASRLTWSRRNATTNVYHATYAHSTSHNMSIVQRLELWELVHSKVQAPQSDRKPPLHLAGHMHAQLYCAEKVEQIAIRIDAIHDSHRCKPGCVHVISYQECLESYRGGSGWTADIMVFSYY